MKEVKIYITGDILAVDYCSHKYEEYDDEFWFAANYYLICGWGSITGLYVNPEDPSTMEDNDENLVKKKGKYVKTKELFSNLFKEDGEHPLPVETHMRTYHNQFACYTVELEDDEEFDIKKVQLEKSLEIDTSILPYFIVADYILYDGKKIITEDTMDYYPEEKNYDTYTIEEL